MSIVVVDPPPHTHTYTGQLALLVHAMLQLNHPTCGEVALVFDSTLFPFICVHTPHRHTKFSVFGCDIEEHIYTTYRRIHMLFAE